MRERLNSGAGGVSAAPRTAGRDLSVREASWVLGESIGAVRRMCEQGLLGAWRVVDPSGSSARLRWHVPSGRWHRGWVPSLLGVACGRWLPVRSAHRRAPHAANRRPTLHRSRRPDRFLLATRAAIIIQISVLTQSYPQIGLQRVKK